MTSHSHPAGEADTGQQSERRGKCCHGGGNAGRPCAHGGRRYTGPVLRLHWKISPRSGVAVRPSVTTDLAARSPPFPCQEQGLGAVPATPCSSPEDFPQMTSLPRSFSKPLLLLQNCWVAAPVTWGERVWQMSVHGVRSPTWRVPAFHLSGLPGAFTDTEPSI